MTTSANVVKQGILPTIIFIFLATCFLCIGSAGDDDSYITYSAVHLLAQTGEIINLNGERVEQSSSLLLVLLLALLQKITHLPASIIGMVASVVSGAALIVVLSSFVRRQQQELSQGWILLLLISTPAFFYWAFSGMETTLYALLFVLIAISVADSTKEGFSLQSKLFLGFLILLHLLMRPESPFVLLAGMPVFLSFGWVLFWRKIPSVNSRRILVLTLWVFLLAVGIALWRDHYFGQYFPQPVYAKSTGLSMERSAHGLLYLLGSLHYTLFLNLLLIVADMCVTWSKPSLELQNFLWIATAFVLAQLAFVIAGGGDFMEGGRFLAPVVPLMLIAGFYAIPAGRAKIPVLCLWLVCSFYDAFCFIRNDSLGTLYVDRSALREQLSISADANTADAYGFFEYSNRLHMSGLPVAEALQEVVTRLESSQQVVTILSGQMGLIPYRLVQQHFGNVRFMDRWGLVTTDVTRCKEAQHLERGKLGLSLDYQEWFKFAEETKSTCGLEMPMVVYDFLNGADVQVLEQRGYQVVYEHRGKVERLHGGASFSSAHFIAVRGDLRAYFDR